MLLSDYSYAGKYSGVQKTCRVTELVLEAWGPEQNAFHVLSTSDYL